MKPHKHAELIKAWADGAEIQYRFNGQIAEDAWQNHYIDQNPTWSYSYEYRIKPEPKPDVVRYLNQLRPLFEEKKHWEESEYEITKTRIKLTFDGETGELKSAEVLK